MINMDVSEKLVIHTASEDWQASQLKVCGESL